MKTTLYIMLAIVLTGCGTPEQMRHFAQGFSEASQYRAHVYQQQPIQLESIKPNLMDYQCFQNCTNAGYQYGLCKSKCSY